MDQGEPSIPKSNSNDALSDINDSPGKKSKKHGDSKSWKKGIADIGSPKSRSRSNSESKKGLTKDSPKHIRKFHFSSLRKKEAQSDGDVSSNEDLVNGEKPVGNGDIGKAEKFKIELPKSLKILGTKSISTPQSPKIRDRLQDKIHAMKKSKASSLDIEQISEKNEKELTSTTKNRLSEPFSVPDDSPFNYFTGPFDVTLGRRGSRHSRRGSSSSQTSISEESSSTLSNASVDGFITDHRQENTPDDNKIPTEYTKNDSDPNVPHTGLNGGSHREEIDSQSSRLHLTRELNGSNEEIERSAVSPRNSRRNFGRTNSTFFEHRIDELVSETQAYEKYVRSPISLNDDHRSSELVQSPISHEPQIERATCEPQPLRASNDPQVTRASNAPQMKRELSKDTAEGFNSIDSHLQQVLHELDMLSIPDEEQQDTCDDSSNVTTEQGATDSPTDALDRNIVGGTNSPNTHERNHVSDRSPEATDDTVQANSASDFARHPPTISPSENNLGNLLPSQRKRTNRDSGFSEANASPDISSLLEERNAESRNGSSNESLVDHTDTNTERRHNTPTEIQGRSRDQVNAEGDYKAKRTLEYGHSSKSPSPVTAIEKQSSFEKLNSPTLTTIPELEASHTFPLNAIPSQRSPPSPQENSHRSSSDSSTLMPRKKKKDVNSMLHMLIDELEDVDDASDVDRLSNNQYNDRLSNNQYNGSTSTIDSVCGSSNDSEDDVFAPVSSKECSSKSSKVSPPCHTILRRSSGTPDSSEREHNLKLSREKSRMRLREVGIFLPNSFFFEQIFEM